jgi:hypothetical protein
MAQAFTFFLTTAAYLEFHLLVHGESPPPSFPLTTDHFEAPHSPTLPRNVALGSRSHALNAPPTRAHCALRNGTRALVFIHLVSPSTFPLYSPLPTASQHCTVL